MDTIDRDLLTELVHDGRMTYQELARTVRLSANAVAERIRRLKETGLLRGYHAQLDPRVLGRTLRAFTDVRLRDGVIGADFERGLRTVPQVVAAAHITGDYDYLLDIVCVDPPELEFVVELIKREHGARELRSRIVLRDIELDPARILMASPRT
ncbi:MAG TPA: Lrp/AsnC family transcriptional regulator [Pseudonocardiaceae bacterium]